MFLAWFHVPVTVTEWLWERYRICKTMSTSVTTTKPGTQLSLRHCGLEYTSWYHQLQWHHTDHRYNPACAPSCFSGQCQNKL